MVNSFRELGANLSASALIQILYGALRNDYSERDVAIRAAIAAVHKERVLNLPAFSESEIEGLRECESVAIKDYCKRTGVSSSDAMLKFRQFVDDAKEARRLNSIAVMADLSELSGQEIEYIQKGEKIQAILAFRTRMGCELPEAKNKIEELWDKYAKG